MGGTRQFILCALRLLCASFWQLIVKPIAITGLALDVFHSDGRKIRAEKTEGAEFALKFLLIFSRGDAY
jgi:hypothetical protein